MYRRRRRVGVLFVLTFLFGVLVVVAPEAEVAIADGFWAAGEESIGAVQESASIMAAQVEVR